MSGKALRDNAWDAQVVRLAPDTLVSTILASDINHEPINISDVVNNDRGATVQIGADLQAPQNSSDAAGKRAGNTSLRPHNTWRARAMYVRATLAGRLCCEGKRHVVLATAGATPRQRVRAARVCPGAAAECADLCAPRLNPHCCARVLGYDASVKESSTNSFRRQLSPRRR